MPFIFFISSSSSVDVHGWTRLSPSNALGVICYSHHTWLGNWWSQHQVLRWKLLPIFCCNPLVCIYDFHGGRRRDLFLAGHIHVILIKSILFFTIYCIQKIIKILNIHTKIDRVNLYNMCAIKLLTWNKNILCLK